MPKRLIVYLSEAVGRFAFAIYLVVLIGVSAWFGLTFGTEAVSAAGVEPLRRMITALTGVEVTLFALAVGGLALLATLSERTREHIANARQDLEKILASVPTADLRTLQGQYKHANKSKVDRRYSYCGFSEFDPRQLLDALDDMISHRPTPSPVPSGPSNPGSSPVEGSSGDILTPTIDELPTLDTFALARTMSAVFLSEHCLDSGIESIRNASMEMMRVNNAYGVARVVTNLVDNERAAHRSIPMASMLCLVAIVSELVLLSSIKAGFPGTVVAILLLPSAGVFAFAGFFVNQLLKRYFAVL